MKPDVDTQLPVDDVSSQAESFGKPGGTLLGWYTTAQGRRHIHLISTADRESLACDPSLDNATRGDDGGERV